MNLFSIIEDQVVLRNQNGVFTQVKLAHRGGYLYATLGSNRFVQLYANHETSSPVWRWQDFTSANVYHPDGLSRLKIQR